MFEELSLRHNEKSSKPTMLNFQDIFIKLVVVAIWFANADSKGKKPHPSMYLKCV